MAAGRHSSVRAAACGLLLAALTATGCMSRNYMEMYDLPEVGWAQDQSVVFTFRPDSVATAGGEGQWIDITVRHRADFPYADLPLEIKGVAPDKRFWTDTVDFPLATLSENGAYRWAGRSYSNHYDITRRYRSGIRYSGNGEYALSVRQLTGEDTLRGILSVGVVAGGTHPAGMR
ncbi:MAG: gliding motility lipoprotein GldH [Rikenellaceae bacterium]|nr:gliding motility lipoprotein GldH [Rikenellaceae bacterium]